MGEMIKETAFAMQHPVFAWLLIGVVVFIAVLILSGRLRITNGKFVLGDNTKYIDTNARFKDLCKNVFDIHEEVHVITDRLDILDKKCTHLELCQLETKVTNDSLPITERAKAFEDYKNRGGNGWCEAYYKKKIKPALEASIE